MDRKVGERAEVRFSAYVEGLGSELGHADRIGPLRDYCTGLILPGERKSVEPIAAKTAPARTLSRLIPAALPPSPHRHTNSVHLPRFRRRSNSLAIIRCQWNRSLSRQALFWRAV